MDTHPTTRHLFPLALAFLLAGGILLLLAACAPTGLGTPGRQGTLTGDVVAGPTCPVAPAGSPCPLAPVTDRQVTITTSSGSVAATTKTDGQGHFSVALAPGSYNVQVAIVPGQIGIRQTTFGQATITAGQTTHIQIVLDTGIR